MQTGTAFGLHFRCRRALPELTASDHHRQTAVHIDWGDAPFAVAQPIPDALLSATADSLTLRVPDIANYAVTAERIHIEPAAGVDDASVRAFLFGSAIGALLQLRGLTVLHGSAVRLADGSAAVFCGVSTAGKSTLAAALASRGHQLLADDITAVRFDDQGRPMCLPGLARTKLWRHALLSLGLAHQAVPAAQVRPDLDKFSLPMPLAPQPAPLRRFYELRAHEQGTLRFSPVTGLEKMNLLLAHTFRSTFLAAMGRQAQQVRAAASLAPQLAMMRIERPRAVQTLDAICDRLEDEWASAAPSV